MKQKEEMSFRYTYSATQQEELESIRNKYIPREESKMEQLRRLDASVTKKANIISIGVGVVGALILGVGMSMVMSDFGKLFGGMAMPLGILFGVIGLAVLSLAYPLYHRTLKSEREKVAPEILRLTDELMQSSSK